LIRKKKYKCLFPNAGQVHRARLSGREVVVKVQRPGLKDLFDIDLKNLRVSIISYSACTSSPGRKCDMTFYYLAFNFVSYI